MLLTSNVENSIVVVCSAVVIEAVSVSIVVPTEFTGIDDWEGFTVGVTVTVLGELVKSVSYVNVSVSVVTVADRGTVDMLVI